MPVLYEMANGGRCLIGDLITAPLQIDYGKASAFVTDVSDQHSALKGVVK